MPEFENYIDVDPYEFIRSCSSREIDDLIEALKGEGLIDGKLDNRNKSVLDLEWDSMCERIKSNRLRMSNEDEDTLKTIADKF